eukprot:Awhi_evm1s8226
MKLASVDKDQKSIDVDGISIDSTCSQEQEVRSLDLHSLASVDSEDYDQIKFSTSTKRSSSKSTSFLTYKQHFGPDRVSKYFLPPRPTKRQKQVVCVIIPFYNEEKCDLKRTLESLYKQEQDCHRAVRQYGMEELVFHYLAVSDGYYKGK